MRLYNAKVRIAGSPLNEVYKPDITAAEITVLKRIHGEDAVLEITDAGKSVRRSDAVERARLSSEYRSGPDIDRKRVDGKKFIEGIFGVGGVALPQTYEAAAPVVETEEVVEEEIIYDAKIAPNEKVAHTPVRKPVVAAADLDAMTA